MKKVLLLSASICMALAMNAQKISNVEKATLSVDKTLISPTIGKSYAKSVIANTVTRVKKATEIVKPSISSLTGLYICDNAGMGDGTRSFIECSGISMEQLDEIFVIEGGSEEEPIAYQCNVCIYDLIHPGTETLAVYDEEEGTLSIPFQEIYEEGGTPFYFANITSLEGDQVQMVFSQPYVFTLEEDPNNGWIFVGDENSIGFGDVLLEQSETGLTATGFGGYTMNDILVLPCNYVCESEWRHFMKDPADGFEEAEPYGVFIERVDEETYAIHGFMELATVRATVDEEGVGQLSTFQPMVYAQIDKGVYDYLGPIKWRIDGNDIYADSSIKYINCGFWNFTFTNEETKEETLMEGCFALYDEVAARFEYYSLGVSGEDAGFAPLRVETLFQPLENRALIGIKNATVTSATRCGTFNLAGQRVKDAKGIVIEDGKKVIR